MTIIEDLTNFEKFLKNIFVIAYSKNHDNTCDSALTPITEKIETFQFHADVSEVSEDCSNQMKKNEQDNNPNQQESFIKSYIQKIKDKAKIESCDESDFIMENYYYLPDFGNRLAALSHEFVCWTNVMLEHFNNKNVIATSCYNETYFQHHKKE